MTFTTPDKTIKTIRKDDSNFYIDNGIAIAPLPTGCLADQKWPDKLMVLG